MRHAATLLLVRDGRDAPEVLLVRRGDKGDFPGVHVFPGGLVDAGDADPRLLAASRRRADDANRRLSTDNALPFYIAALRECIEETGLLPGAEGGEARDWQRALLAREAGFGDLVAQSGGELLTDELGYFSHWITPVAVPRRYDTRFFVARLPGDAEVTVDGRETVSHDWLTAGEALAAGERGEIKLIFPTIRNLMALAEFATIDELLAHAHSDRPVPAILPKLLFGADGMKLLLPGDAGYDAAV